MTGITALFSLPGTVYLIQGVFAGFMAGILMGLSSEILYRLKIFKSSLLLVDGMFFIRSLGINSSDAALYAAGIPIHLITSSIFGGIYIVISAALKINALSPYAVSFYFFIMWLSMLFIALPVAGQGVFGKKLHHSTWLEQLFLHIIFGLAYFVALQKP
jgi:hypothetical protein